MKAIILAAGEGRRLRPLTEFLPKCMVQFHGKPLLEYQLAALRQCGVKDVVVVTGHGGEKLVQAGLRCIRNDEYSSTNMVHSLFCAEGEMNDDFLICYSDIVYEPRILRALLDERAAFSTTVDIAWRRLWEARMADPLADAETMKLDASGNIMELGKRPTSYSEVQAQYMGLIKVTGSMVDRLKDHYLRLDRGKLYEGRSFKNMFMTSFLQSLIDGGSVLKAVPVEGGWVEIDAPADLELPLPLGLSFL